MADPRGLEEGLGNTEFVNEDHKDDSNQTECKTDAEDGIENVERREERTVDGDRSLLNAFIGFVIVMMIMLHAGGAYPGIAPSPWNGCTFADLVMPLYLFSVGFATTRAFKIIPKLQYAIMKIIVVTMKLFLWGILLQGGYLHEPNDLSYGVDMKHIRWCGMLQKIAVVYMVVALIEVLTTKQRPTVLTPGYLSIYTAYKWQWIGGFVALLIYLIVTYTLYVPDWSFVVYKQEELKRNAVKCCTRGELGPACNAAGYVDRVIWGINHLYSSPAWQRLKACIGSSPNNSGPFGEDTPSWCHAPFEPEGLLSTVSAILSGTIGIHYGHIFIHFKSHSERLKQWISMGLSLLTIGLILHFADAIPINRQLYSFSFVCFTAGIAGIVFSGFYILIDVLGWRTPFLFLEWIGMNEMLVFVLGAQGVLARLLNGWYYKSADNTLVNWIQTHIFVSVSNSERLGTLYYVIFVEITFWGAVAGILHKLGIYWKL